MAADNENAPFDDEHQAPGVEPDWAALSKELSPGALAGVLDCVVCGGERSEVGRLMCDTCSARADGAIIDVDVSAPPRI